MMPYLASLGTPFQGITVALIIVFGTVIIWYIRGWPERRRALNETAKLKLEDDQVFRAELLAREGLLTQRVGALERTITRERRIHTAERALDRHRLNNITQCFDAMLLLIEMNPDRATEIVKKIKEMRATQMLAEAEEKAALRVAEIHDDEDSTEEMAQ
jgi:cbb3-type cytochrome oxidase subunit 3